MYRTDSCQNIWGLIHMNQEKGFRDIKRFFEGRMNFEVLNSFKFLPKARCFLNNFWVEIDNFIIRWDLRRRSRMTMIPQKNSCEFIARSVKN